ncbi:MAG: hypothetical protein ACOCSQ_02540, partial [Planctomycetota bacterium]
MKQLHLGATTIKPIVTAGELQSIGSPCVGNTCLRTSEVRFLPWFDSYKGQVFPRFRFCDIEENEDRTVIHTRAVSNPDYPFIEERDSSGDVCLRGRSWDAEPREGDFRVVLEPAEEIIDGRHFSGFRYHFEYDGETPIHRLHPLVKLAYVTL